jgi:hypothetical protein
LDDHWLATKSSGNWNGMVTLSEPFWEARPTNCEFGIREVFKLLSDYIQKILTISKVRYGLLPLSQPVMPHRLAHGAYDLAAVVVGPLGLSPNLRSAAIRRLDDEFVRRQHHWSILWPARTNNREVIPTYIDVERDPIVGQLTAWLRNADAGTPPPVYPAVDVVDPRPEEPVPDVFQAMDADVWPQLERAGLARTFKMFLTYYNHANVNREPLLPTLAVCGERLRQWKRISVADELSYKDMVKCLGWYDIENDYVVVQRITDALLRQQKVVTAAWYVKRAKGCMWRPSVCFPMMRVACILVSRLRQGGAPLEKLSTAIQYCS